ncbi:MAG: PQQ-binding-like beta-propeller repeat protein [Planctomycetes bacterium]|nr:PQQ-binding-like beta-propeller repeat protein [Planctomycetota bacterium]
MRPLIVVISLSLSPWLPEAEPRAAPGPETGAPLGPWPSFRGGPDLRGWREGPMADAPRLLWSFDAKGEVSSTAAIAQGRVYVGTAEAGLLCLDLNAAGKAGKELWRAAADSRVQSSPGVRDGRVYFGDDSGVFRALDAETGSVVWKLETRTLTDGGGEIVSSAAFHEDRVLFGSYDAHLYCVSAKDGKVLWRHRTEGPVHATPALVEGRTFVAGCDEQLRAVSASDGKELAVLAMGAYSAASPAVSGERLVVGTFGAQVLCVDWKASKVAWTYKHPEKEFPFYSSPAVGPLQEKQVVVVGGRDKLVHAIALEDGKPLWTFPTRARVDASPVIVGNRVIAASLDGNVYLLDLETGKEVWKFVAGSAVAASPAVGEGRLVISSEDGVVHCFDVTPKAP